MGCVRWLLYGVVAFRLAKDPRSLAWVLAQQLLKEKPADLLAAQSSNETPDLSRDLVPLFHGETSRNENRPLAGMKEHPRGCTFTKRRSRAISSVF
jgi:hypothetical protein